MKQFLSPGRSVLLSCLLLAVVIGRWVVGPYLFPEPEAETNPRDELSRISAKSRPVRETFDHTNAGQTDRNQEGQTVDDISALCPTEPGVNRSDQQISEKYSQLAHRFMQMVVKERWEAFAHRVAQYQAGLERGAIPGLDWLYAQLQAHRDSGLDYTASLEEIIEAAARGDAAALHALGRYFETGTATEQDFREAAGYYEVAAALGNADAMVDLGRLYEAGLGTEQSYAESVRYFMEAYRLGNSDGAYYLGLAHLQGVSLPRDMELAKTYLGQASQQGNVNAQYALADLLIKRSSSSTQREVALSYAKQAADAGLREAQYLYGASLLRDADETGWSYLYHSAAQGHYKALQHILESAMQVDGDLPMAESLLTLHAANGRQEAVLIMSYLSLLQHEDPAKAKQMVEGYLRPNTDRLKYLLAHWSDELPLLHYRYMESFELDYQTIAKWADNDHLAKLEMQQTAEDSLPRVLTWIVPEYPVSLILDRVEGFVQADYVINSKGEVIEVKINESTHPLFAEAVRRALQRTSFIPGTKNGVPCKYILRRRFNFSPDI